MKKFGLFVILQLAVIGGNSLASVISFASILAKVMRDRLLCALDRHF
ncbi:hypothetical protein DSUL_60234 [Desulfovibrionales bacterium]